MQRATFDYAVRDRIGYLSFMLPTGALSTTVCQQFLAAYLTACQQPTDLLVLQNEHDCWGRGLDSAENAHADTPDYATWRNLLALNDLIETIIMTERQVVIAAIRGHAIGGSVMLALAADVVILQESALLYPHFERSAEFGSQYWTYLLPRRVGQELAWDLMTARTPLTSSQALACGLVDHLLPTKTYTDDLHAFALTVRSDCAMYLHRKRLRLQREEQSRALFNYRCEEQQLMHAQLFD